MSTLVVATRRTLWLAVAVGTLGSSIIGALVGGLAYDLCVFKGGESPVNHSFNRPKMEYRMQERTWLRRFGKLQAAEVAQRKSEEGTAYEDRRQST